MLQPQPGPFPLPLILFIAKGASSLSLVLLKCHTPLKTQEVWRPKGRIIFLSHRPATWSSVLLRLKPDNKRSRNRGIYLLNQICVHHGCGAGKYCVYEKHWGVCGGSGFQWLHTLTALGLGFRDFLPPLLSISRCFLTLVAFPDFVLQLEYNISPRCCLN